MERKIPEGQRREELFRIASGLRGVKGLDEADILAELREINRSRLFPHLRTVHLATNRASRRQYGYPPRQHRSRHVSVSRPGMVAGALRRTDGGVEGHMETWRCGHERRRKTLVIKGDGAESADKPTRAYDKSARRRAARVRFYKSEKFPASRARYRNPKKAEQRHAQRCSLPAI